MNKIIQNIFPFLSYAIIVYLAVQLSTRYADVLFYAQDFSAWMASASYLKDTVLHPGGLLEWCGGFLTQFFFYPALGAAILAVMWCGILFCWNKALALTGPWQLLPLVFVLLIFGYTTSLGYWLFCNVEANHWFVPTLAMLVIGIACWCFRSCSPVAKVILIVAWVAIGFPVFGWYDMLGLVMMFGIMRIDVLRRHYLWLFGGLFVVFASLAWIYTDSLYIYWKQPLFFYGFPSIANGIADAPDLLAPIYYMSLFSLVIVLLSRITVVKPWGVAKWITSFLIVGGVGFYTMSMPYPDDNYYTELRMMRHLDAGEFRDVLKVMKQSKQQPTREMVLMKDVALAQLGELGEHAFDYDVRGVKPVDKNGLDVHIGHSAGPIIYYWFGLPNYTYMWCWDNSIEHGCSPYWLKLLYRSCMVNGEETLARKYKKQLDGLLFNSNPTIGSNEIKRVKRFMTGSNELANDEGLCERFLLMRLSTQRYNTAEGQQIALHYSMLMRNADAFMHALEHYFELTKNNTSTPKYVGEAYLAFTRGQNSRFQAYQQDVMQLAQRKVNIDVAGDRLYPVWGHTFWWYFDFYTNQDFY